MYRAKRKADGLGKRPGWAAGQAGEAVSAEIANLRDPPGRRQIRMMLFGKSQGN